MSSLWTLAAEAPKKQVVLLIDDQTIVAEAIRRMLADQADLELLHCADVARALPFAREVRPSVILQDLVMPGADGFTLVRYFRADPQVGNVPIIVLSSKEEPRDKSRAFEISTRTSSVPSAPRRSHTPGLRGDYPRSIGSLQAWT